MHALPPFHSVCDHETQKKEITTAANVLYCISQDKGLASNPSHSVRTYAVAPRRDKGKCEQNKKQ